MSNDLLAELNAIGEAADGNDIDELKREMKNVQALISKLAKTVGKGITTANDKIARLETSIEILQNKSTAVNIGGDTTFNGEVDQANVSTGGENHNIQQSGNNSEANQAGNDIKN